MEKEKEIIGLVEYNIYGEDWSDADYFINRENVSDILSSYRGKRIKLTIEVLPDPEKGEKIQLKLKRVVLSDEACQHLGISIWCVAEGADGEEWVTLYKDDAKRWGLV